MPDVSRLCLFVAGAFGVVLLLDLALLLLARPDVWADQVLALAVGFFALAGFVVGLVLSLRPRDASA